MDPERGGGGKSQELVVKDEEVKLEEGALSGGDLTQADLNSMNEGFSESEIADQVKILAGYDHAEGLAARLGVDPKVGLRDDQLGSQKDKWGDNTMPAAQLQTFCEFFIASFNDATLIILIIFAIISLALGLSPLSHEENGWVEGAAILVAVFLVAIVTAANDYKKQMMFVEIEQQAADQESCTVFRNGEDKVINPRDILVGDILVIRKGDKVYADTVLLTEDDKGVHTDEMSLTGESIEVHHTRAESPFILSSTLCVLTGDLKQVHAVVLGTGANSQYGKIKANISGEENNEQANTPLQDKLEVMALRIGYFGGLMAVLTFIVMMIALFTYDTETETATGIVDAAIIAVTIVVVAVPEGLPLAVTISLAYSTKQMLEEQNFIRVLAACETMGNATNICSDKTGTLTEGRMAVVEGWYGNQYIDDKTHSTLTFKQDTAPWKELVFANISNTSQGQVIYGYENKKGVEFSNRKALLFPWALDKESLVNEVPDDWGLYPPYGDGKANMGYDDYSREPQGSGGLFGSSGSVKKLYIQEKLDREKPMGGNQTEMACLMLAHAHGCDTKNFEVGKQDVSNIIPEGIAESFPFKEPKFCYKQETLKDFPFDSNKKCSSTVIQLKEPAGGMTHRAFTVGAAEKVIEMCDKFMDIDGSSQNLDSAKREEFQQMMGQMQGKALRLICFAHRDAADLSLGTSEEEFAQLCNSGMTCDAIVGILDPPRSDVKDAVKKAQGAGIKVRMVTGDHVNTAKEIGSRAGIYREGDVALEGPEFRKMTPAAVDNILDKLTVIGRCSPEDKFLLVTRLNGRNIPGSGGKDKEKEEWEAFHKTRNPEATWEADKDKLLPGYYSEWKEAHPEGAVVGVTGDGTNDAPALKIADVGLAMGSGTEVAKGASDIVILDDKFYSIVNAIKWGRCVYDNIRKFLQFQLTVNVVALLVVFVGATIPAYGGKPPLNAIQMLWVNLIMDTMGALALGTEKPTEALLQRRPYKKSSWLISPLMMRNILAQSVYQLIICLVLLSTGPAWFPNDNIEKGSHVHYTLIYNAFIFCQVFNEFNAREIGNKVNVFENLQSNTMFQGIIVVTIVLQIFLVEFCGPIGFETKPLTAVQWVVTSALGLGSLLVGVVMRYLPPQEEPDSVFAG